MVTSLEVHSHKLSSVVPGAVTGDEVIHELTNMDLAMKLHYLRTVYFFKANEVIEGLGIFKLKEPLFLMLNVFYPVAGRIRRTDSGRPFIRCNDSGVRIIEAQCDKTINEFLEIEHSSVDGQFAADKVLGPDLGFSPLVYIQLTRFKCGGMAVGLSWAHILGDAISATNSINMWGQFLTKNKSPTDQNIPKIQPKRINNLSTKLTSATPNTLIKQVPPVEDHWVCPTNHHQMATFSFQISSPSLSSFESLSALIWKCLAKIRQGREPHLVTVCRSIPAEKKTGLVLSNDQFITSVHCESSLSKIDVSELAQLIAEARVDKKKEIEELIDSESGEPSFIFYGANLTFVDLENVEFYGLEIKGQKPVHVSFKIDGVGDEGLVLVLPAGDGEGKKVTAILPEDDILKLREVLEIEWNVVVW
ncbi:Transferase protein [Dioscorea alata]|uniref:Transferase protein n=1 Tax=Dioscorea alata TaxID=55571 RepID=A0ACB7VEA8_DIOAL|nr:Transferase protein [Dioscorea alata]